MKPDLDSVVVLASRGALSHALVHALDDTVGVAHVVFEHRDLRRVLARRRRRLGTRRLLGQLLEVAVDRTVAAVRQRPRIRHALAPYDLSPPDGRVPTTDVASANSDEVVALLDRLAPRVVVVSGTSILGSRVLERPAVFLNLHCGITPAYRGVHGAFWAVVDGRPDRAGTTIHVVDAGIDTGEVIGQARIRVERGDGLRTLVAKQYAVGIPLMVDAVRDAMAGTLAPTAPDGPSRLHTSPTLADHARFVRQMRRIAR